MSRSFSSTVAAGKGVLPRSSMGARLMPAGAMMTGVNSQFGSNASVMNAPSSPNVPQDSQTCYAAGGSWEQDPTGNAEFSCVLPVDRTPMRNPNGGPRFGIPGTNVNTGDSRTAPPSMNGDGTTAKSGTGDGTTGGSGTSDRSGPPPGTGDMRGPSSMTMPPMATMPRPMATMPPPSGTMQPGPRPMPMPMPVPTSMPSPPVPTTVVPVPTAKVNPFCPPNWLTSPPQSLIQTPNWRDGSTWSGNSYQTQYSSAPSAPVAFYTTQQPCILPSGRANPAGAVLIQNSSLSPLFNGIVFVAAAAAAYTVGKKVFG